MSTMARARMPVRQECIYWLQFLAEKAGSMDESFADELSSKELSETLQAWGYPNL